MQFEVNTSASEAENAVRNHLPVQVPDGRIGVAVGWNGVEVKVAFTDGTDPRWFHHTYVFVNV
jgi:hypothetical protein